MGKKVFASRVLRNPDLKRNSIDLSRINHMTTKIGQLTPCFLQEVVPGDSINIKADFGFRFMPMAFPVQSPIRADIHFFYVRTRTLWDNFTAFRFDTIKGVEHPFIKTNDNTFFSNGSLADYLGVPTTQFQSESDYQVIQIISEDEAQNLNPNPYNQNTGAVIYAGRGSYGTEVPKDLGLLFLAQPIGQEIDIKIGHKISEYLGSELPLLLFSSSININAENNKFEFFIDFPKAVVDSAGGESFEILFYTKTQGMIKEEATFTGQLLSPKLVNTETRQLVDNDSSSVIVRKYYSSSAIFGNGIYRDENLYKFFEQNPNTQIAILFRDKRAIYYITEDKQVGFYGVNNIQIGVKAANEIPVTTSPFAIQTGETTPRIPISSLPFRAYEACYNSFFRNTIVSPFRKKVVVNGVETEQEVFDDYVTTKADGADETPYKLYQRNWEKDVFTSAWKTPQFGGSQPLIGATSSNQPFEVQQMQIQEQGATPKTINILVGDDSKVVGLSRYSDNFPLSSIDALNSAIEYGISINDLRNVDALQIWLENNVANGYKYKDEMLSHFGVNVDFSILSMPEYIGGVSRHLNVNTIYQSIETEQNPIGSFGGVGNITGNTEYDINKYCEEDGFIIGILSIVPIPSYSQLLPRVFQKTHFLDYYNPEFSHIGMQPIFKKDISPLTTDGSNQNEVFGYTKPNWEYLQAVDEIHGDFRDKLRNFVINREFSNTPSLVQDFIEIKPTEVNDIFSYRENTDKIVGMVSFKCTAKRPIPIMLNPQIK